MEGPLSGDPRGSGASWAEPEPRPRSATASRARRALPLVLALLLAALLLLVAWQELRWQLHEPFVLRGLSHAVGVPVGETLSIGYQLRNRSRMPLVIEGIELPSEQRRTITGTRRLEVLELAALPTGELAIAAQGRPIDRGLRTAPVEGAHVPPDQNLALVASFVGTGPGRFYIGPFTVRYRFGPFRGSQRLPLSRAYGFSVTPRE